MTAFARYWLPPLVWMALIWGLSSDVASAERTSGLFAWIVTSIFPWATPAQINLAHGLGRKLGHLTEYAILAALWFRALHTGRRLPSAPSAWAALAISIAWAITDELHQASVPSRTASGIDVILDTTGATLVLLALHLTRRGASPPFRRSAGLSARSAASPQEGLRGPASFNVDLAGAIPSSEAQEECAVRRATTARRSEASNHS